jgi:hypothetical protein
MNETLDYSVIDTKSLVELNDKAVKAEFNRSLTDDFIKSLDPNGFHLVINSMIHNDTEMRMEILCKQNGSKNPVEVWLDCSFNDFLHNVKPISFQDDEADDDDDE